MRAQTIVLLQRAAMREREHFEVMCTLEKQRHGHRPRQLRGFPAQFTDTPEWRRWHQAVEALREHVDADRALALAERHELLATQVREEAQLEDDLAALRRSRAGAAARDARRQAWNERRGELIDLRDALWNGLGFPHRGETVDVCTERYRSLKGQAAEAIVYDGPAVYIHSYSILDDQHVVAVPDGDQPGLQFEIHAHWSEIRLPDGPEPPRRQPRFPSAEDLLVA